MATRDLNRQKVPFHAHPRFTRIVQLWGGNGRYNTTRSFYRQQVAATRTQIGKDTRDAAVNKAVQTAGSLWPGLKLIQWSELHSIPGITVYTAQTLLRLKANRLSMWNYEKADLSCSNPECSQVVQSSVQHLLWECPKAKLVWNYFYALWAKIGITPGHDPATWIFSLDLPDTPKRAWTTIKRHIIGHRFSNEHQDHLYSVAHMLWRYMSASLIHAIWCAHLRRMDSDPIKSTAEMAIMMTRLEAGMGNLTRLAEAQAGDSDGHTVAAVLKVYVDCFLSQTDAIPLTPNGTRGVYLLFFDGGSRGNPGPGGTGSIIVCVHKDSHTASLIWAASMAYSREDTTNNFAEYWGLIHGLREAQRSHFEPLYVIGDSALIISQQRMHRSPRQHRLARLYQTSRRLADCIDIRGWYHHYRAFNKMADSAANLAMDTRTSTQVHFPTQRAAFNNLTQDLDNDVMHWLIKVTKKDEELLSIQCTDVAAMTAVTCEGNVSRIRVTSETSTEIEEWEASVELFVNATRVREFGAVAASTLERCVDLSKILQLLGQDTCVNTSLFASNDFGITDKQRLWASMLHLDSRVLTQRIVAKGFLDHSAVAALYDPSPLKQRSHAETANAGRESHLEALIFLDVLVKLPSIVDQNVNVQLLFGERVDRVFQERLEAIGISLWVIHFHQSYPNASNGRDLTQQKAQVHLFWKDWSAQPSGNATMKLKATLSQSMEITVSRRVEIFYLASPPSSNVVRVALEREERHPIVHFSDQPRQTTQRPVLAKKTTPR
ncbi:reverse transcriptase, partial [Globisporangium splendens]